MALLVESVTCEFDVATGASFAIGPVRHYPIRLPTLTTIESPYRSADYGSPTSGVKDGRVQIRGGAGSISLISRSFRGGVLPPMRGTEFPN